MVVYKTYQFRLYPSKEQQEKINQNLGSSRFIYNYYLDKRIEMYQENKKSMSLSEMKKDILNLKKIYPWIEEVDSCVLRTSLEDLDRAYQKFFKENNGFPKFKAKGKKDSYRTVNNRSTYKGKDYASIEIDIKKRTIKLPKVGEVEIRGYRNLTNFPHKIFNATIRKIAGRYYVSVCVEEVLEEKEFELHHSIGIDVGVKSTISCSDGSKYTLTKKIERCEVRLKKLQKKLARSVKGSKNRYKLIEKIQRVYLKIRNMRKYFIHEVTTKIIKENDIVTTETLAVKEMIENKETHLAKYISNSSFSEIIRQLKYKANRKGKKFYQIAKYFPSSQICNRCGERERNIKDLNIREWECKKCGNMNDRDINASMNIEEEGMKMYLREIYDN